MSKNLIKGRLRSEYWILMILGILFFLGGYLLANDVPILSICDGHWLWFHSFSSLDCEFSIRPLIVVMDGETIRSGVSPFAPPLHWTKNVGLHLLGTDGLGRDVLAGILHGGRKSVLIGVCSGLLAVGFGWGLGLIAAFFTQVPLKLTKIPLFLIIVGILISITFLFSMPEWILGLALLCVLGGLRFFITAKPKVNVGWMLARSMEWYQALPDLLILIVLSTVFHLSSIWSLVLIMSIISWPNFAMMARREGVEVIQQPYFKQALRNEVPTGILFRNYLFNNTKHIFWAVFPLAVSRFILMESTLTFLGLGLSPDIVTLGSMLNGAKDNLSAWWILIFSGGVIFILIYVLQRLGYHGMKSRAEESV